MDPRIKRTTVKMHVDGMSTNNFVRKHHPPIKPGSGHDLFYKLGPDKFRLWYDERDPGPLDKQDIEVQELERGETGDEPVDQTTLGAASEFAFERDLRITSSKT